MEEKDNILEQMHKLANELEQKRDAIDFELKNLRTSIQYMSANLKRGPKPISENEKKDKDRELVKTLRKSKYDPKWSGIKKTLYAVIHNATPEKPMYTSEVANILLEVDTEIKAEYESIKTSSAKYKFIRTLKARVSYNCTTLYTRGILTRQRIGTDGVFALSPDM